MRRLLSRMRSQGQRVNLTSTRVTVERNRQEIFIPLASLSTCTSSPLLKNESPVAHPADNDMPLARLGAWTAPRSVLSACFWRLARNQFCKLQCVVVTPRGRNGSGKEPRPKNEVHPFISGSLYFNSWTSMRTRRSRICCR